MSNPLHREGIQGRRGMKGCNAANSGAQLFLLHGVEFIDRPEAKQVPETLTPGELVHYEEIRTRSIARFHTSSCGLFCAGRDSHRSAAPDCRTPGSASGAGFRVDRWISSLGRWPLCVGSRALGTSATSSCTLASTPLGAQARRVGPTGRPLALKKGIRKPESGAQTPLSCCLTLLSAAFVAKIACTNADG